MIMWRPTTSLVFGLFKWSSEIRGHAMPSSNDSWHPFHHGSTSAFSTCLFQPKPPSDVAALLVVLPRPGRSLGRPGHESELGKLRAALPRIIVGVVPGTFVRRRTEVVTGGGSSSKSERCGVCRLWKDVGVVKGKQPGVCLGVL